MKRSASLHTVLLCLLLALISVPSGEAATKKSSTKKRSSSAATKKSTPADSGDKKAGESPDLPLPAKKESGGEEQVGKKSETTETKEAEQSPPKAAAEKSETPAHAPNATVEPEDIVEFATESPRTQNLLRDAINLTRLNLTYTFGSANPDNGGMDCSGTIYYLLRAHGFEDVARDSRGQYLWVRKTGTFYPVLSKEAESEEFEQLRPGDLMFWTGTYQTGREIPVSHVMLYLGREKKSGKRIMFGASDGRSYNGVARWGVSVFDFKMPRATNGEGEKTKADFVGYARLAGFGTGAPEVAETQPEVKPAATPKPGTTSKSVGKKSSSKTKKRSQP